MSYFEYPKKIPITYESSNEELNLDWSELRKYSPASDPYNFYPSSTYPIRDVLSKLCREIGYRTNSDDSNYSGTGTEKIDLVNCLRDLSMTNELSFSQDPKYFFEKNRNCLVIQSGKPLSLYGSAHIWVCDGILEFKIRERYYESSDGGITWQLKDTTIGSLTTYLSYNWGSYGKDDGYFIDGLKPLSAPLSKEDFYSRERSCLPVIKP